MVKEGCMEGVTEGVFGFHNDNMLPLGAVWIQPGVASAHCLDFEVTLRGNGGHGSMPHLSKDPLLAACSAVVGINTIVSRRWGSRVGGDQGGDGLQWDDGWRR